MGGIFGVVPKKPGDDCITDAFFGTDYHAHLGTQLGGMVFSGLEGGFWRKIHDLSTGGQFKDHFSSDIKALRAKSGGAVTGGLGVISNSYPQPLIFNAHLGDFALVATGRISNLDFLVNELRQTGPFTEIAAGSVSMIEVVARLICQKDSFAEGIENLWSKIEGSISLLILTSDGKLIAARDRFGVSPLVLGEKDSGYAVAFEGFSLYNIGYRDTREFKPGEIIKITSDGVEIIRPGCAGNCRICAFLYVYTGFPAAEYGGIGVEEARYRCGAALARRDNGLKADLVDGVPDSGTAHAIGYAQASGIPYGRGLVKYTAGWVRSYTPPDQSQRDLVARMKLLPMSGVIRGKDFVLADDSIVRGTQLGEFTLRKLWDCGAKKIHVRIACPPLMFPCLYLRSTRTIGELAARQAIRGIEGTGLSDPTDVSAYLDPISVKYFQMVEAVRIRIGATTLRYQTLADMIAAIGLPAGKFCTYCWTGQKIG